MRDVLRRVLCCIHHWVSSRRLEGRVYPKAAGHVTLKDGDRMVIKDVSDIIVLNSPCVTLHVEKPGGAK